MGIENEEDVNMATVNVFAADEQMSQTKITKPPVRCSLPMVLNIWMLLWMSWRRASAVLARLNVIVIVGSAEHRRKRKIGSCSAYIY